MTKLSPLLFLISTLFPLFVCAQQDTTAQTYHTKIMTALQKNRTLPQQVNQRFSAYLTARGQQMLYACTARLANYNDIQLFHSFYAQAKTISTQFHQARTALNAVLNQLKNDPNFGLSEEIAKFEAQQNPLSAKTITRGYCQNYKKGFAAQIMHNLARYRVEPTAISNSNMTQQNALYLNPHFQVLKLTVTLPHQSTTLRTDKVKAQQFLRLPQTLIMRNHRYPLQCHTEDVQRYERAIALKDKKQVGPLVYQAVHTFYQQVSPQINAIFACQTQKPLTDKLIVRKIDTYPWFQPRVIGGKGQRAAGDAMTYIDKNHLIVILGHEPCACNWNGQANCQKIKQASKQYKHHAWALLAALQKGKAKQNSAAQTAVGHYTHWAKEELKKDFCFIDNKAMVSHIKDMFTKVKAATVKPRTIYFDKKLNVLAVNTQLTQHQAPTFYRIGDNGKPVPIQCTYQNANTIEEHVITRKPDGIKDKIFALASLFYQQVSPEIDYVITCDGKFPTPLAKSRVSDTQGWYQGPYSKHVGVYAQGRALTYMAPKQLIIVIGHRPCLCATRSEKVCQKFMQAVRGQKKAAMNMEKMLTQFEKSGNASEKSKRLIHEYFHLMAQNEKVDPCDQDNKAIDKLDQVQISVRQDGLKQSKPRKWWWPF